MGIECDLCGKENFSGQRYMCANCEDYSLCKTCYDKNEHTKFHVFIKLNYAI